MTTDGARNDVHALYRPVRIWQEIEIPPSSHLAYVETRDVRYEKRHTWTKTEEHDVLRDGT